MRTLTHATVSDNQRDARRALGLPTDRPIVMSGHQAGFWHAGILAKHFAIDAAARAAGAHAAWVVVDQDTEPPQRLSRPVREGDRLVRRDHDFESGVHPDTPTGVRPAVRMPEGGEDFESVVGALNAARAGSSAEQAARANASLVRTRTGVAAPDLVRATVLWKTEAFGELVAAMRGDPAACVDAYNAAARAHPEAGVRELIARPAVDRFELPLWRVRAGEPRRGVMADELGDVPIEELAPRALFMTAVVRLVLCDLFVHGTGGAAYDRVTDAWIGAWIGRRLAPTAMATATLRLDPARFGGVTPASEAEVARAKWRAHAARHRADVLGDDDAERERLALVDAIERLPRGSAERLAAYRRLHAFIEGHRAAHGDAIEALRAEATRVEGTRVDAAIALDRTWPWVLHDDGDLVVLRDRIDGAFGVER